MDIAEKPTCLNCNEPLEGQYCHFCGQKHHDHKESFGELVYEFFSDFTHFDSRFFRTVLPLLFKPGVLTRRYIQGKRAGQFHPIRLYIFSSFLYFLLFFGCGHHDNNITINESPKKVIASDSLQKSDTSQNSPRLSGKININQITVAASEDSTTKMNVVGIKGLDSLIRNEVTPDEYIHQQNLLPASQRDNFFRRFVIKQGLKLYHEGKKDGMGLMNKISSAVIHNIPKMLFVLLPLFALLLKLLYIRKKQFYYVDHAVLSLHYFSFVFILLTLTQFVLGSFFSASFFKILATIWMILYLFIAMKRIYMQSFLKTLLKYSLLGISFFVFVIVALLVNLLVSAALA